MSEFSDTDIERVITGVKRAIRAVQQHGGGLQIINVEKIELTLKALIEKSAGGELKIKIPIIDTNLGAKVGITSNDTQTIQLTLVPIKAATRSLTRSESFEKELFEALVTIREGIKNASEMEPKFTLQNAVVEINFVVNTKGEIAILAKGSEESEIMHSVKLFLGPS